MPVVVIGSNVEADFVSRLSTGYGNFSLYVNSAPTLNNSLVPMLKPVLTNAVSPTRDLVSRLIASSVTDPDPAAVRGIAIVGASGAGTWQISGDGGATWAALGSPSPTAAGS